MRQPSKQHNEVKSHENSTATFNGNQTNGFFFSCGDFGQLPACRIWVLAWASPVLVISLTQKMWWSVHLLPFLKSSENIFLLKKEHFHYKEDMYSPWRASIKSVAGKIWNSSSLAANEKQQPKVIVSTCMSVLLLLNKVTKWQQIKSKT